MKYLCAVYLEPNALQGLSAGEQGKLNRDSLDSAVFALLSVWTGSVFE
jgi:hypothetical protein